MPRAALSILLPRLKTDIYLLLRNTSRDDREGIAKGVWGLETGIQQLSSAEGNHRHRESTG
jgi:hypothetical protein